MYLLNIYFMGISITSVTESSGYQGVSISFVTSKVKDMSNLRAIESLYKIKMPEMPVSSFFLSFKKKFIN